MRGVHGVLRHTNKKQWWRKTTCRVIFPAAFNAHFLLDRTTKMLGLQMTIVIR